MSRPAAAEIVPSCQPFALGAGSTGILLQHGFTGCPASMRPMGEWLAGQGFAVVGPRWPGHGTTWKDLASVTWRDWERTTEAALLELTSRCSDVVAVGLSVGGAMVLHVAVKHPELVRGVVAVNALVRRPELIFTPVLRRVVGSVKGVGNDIKKPGQDEFSYQRIPTSAVDQLGKFLRLIDSELPRMRRPLVVVSSAEDHTVKPSNSRRIALRCGTASTEFVTLSNSYHVATLDHDAPLIFERVRDFARSLASDARTAQA
jgi:carboxylesterase